MTYIFARIAIVFFIIKLATKSDILGAWSGFGMHQSIGFEQRALLITPGIKAPIARDGSSSLCVGPKRRGSCRSFG